MRGERSLVKNFNETHEIGSSIKFKLSEDEEKEVKTRSRAFLGKGRRACILIEGQKGTFSLHRLVDAMNTTPHVQPKPESTNIQENVESAPVVKKRRGRKPKISVESSFNKINFNKLRNNLKSEVRKNGTIQISKGFVDPLFSKVKTEWGNLKPIDQFKIFLSKAKLSIKEEKGSLLVIGPNNNQKHDKVDKHNKEDKQEIVGNNNKAA